MRILIFGGSGMLGHKLVQQLMTNFDVWVTLRSGVSKYERFSLFDPNKTIKHIEVEEPSNYFDLVRIIKPEVIINAIGLIKQLPDSKNVIKTLTINSIFPQQLVEIAGEVNARLINFSTDCVFNGEKGNYTETDVPDAYDLYGKSKNLGEVTGDNCLTLRMSIIGREMLSNKSLVEWFLSNRGGTVKGYTNAIYSGFPTVVFSEIIEGIISNHKNLSGLFHVSSEPINKFDLLQLIREKYNVDIEIEPFADFRIDRSLNSDKFRLETGFEPLSWNKMIEMMANDPTDYIENKI